MNKLGLVKSTEKFRAFLQNVIAVPEQCFLSVRNDGSHEKITELFGREIANHITKVPDGGFFVRCKEGIHPEIVEGKCNIAINLAGDQLELRFSGVNGMLNYARFIEEFACFCAELLNKHEKVRLIFVPHISKDYIIIIDVLKALEDALVRRRITVASLLNGSETDGLINFSLYKKCDLVLGMRYHANVCPIGMGKATIGIVTQEPHVRLYEDIGFQHRCIKVNEEGFRCALMEKVELALNNRSIFIRENETLMERLNQQNDNFFMQIKKWLK